MSTNKKKITNFDLFFPSPDEHCVNARGIHQRIGVKDKHVAWWRRSVLPYVGLTQGLDYIIENPSKPKSAYKLTPQAAIAVLQREKAANRRPCDNSLQAVRGRRAIAHVRKCIAAGRDVPYQELETPGKIPLIGCRYDDEFVVGYKDPTVSESILTRRVSQVNPSRYWTMLDDVPIHDDQGSGIAADLLSAMVPMIATMNRDHAAWAQGSAGDLATHLATEYDFHLQDKKEKKATTTSEDLTVQAEQEDEVEPIGSTSSESELPLGVWSDSALAPKPQRPRQPLLDYRPLPIDHNVELGQARVRDIATTWLWRHLQVPGSHLIEMAECAVHNPQLHARANAVFKALKLKLESMTGAYPSDEALFRQLAEQVFGGDSDEEQAQLELALDELATEQADPINFTVEETTGVAAANPEAKVKVTLDTGRWGVFCEAALEVSPDALPQSVHASKREAEAATRTADTECASKSTHSVKMLPALTEADEAAAGLSSWEAADGSTLIPYQPQDFDEQVFDAPSDGPDYEGPSEASSSSSRTEEPKRVWWDRMKDWLFPSNPSDAIVPVPYRNIYGPGDEQQRADETLKLIRDRRERGAAYARNLYDQAVKESGGLPATLPRPAELAEVESGRRAGQPKELGAPYGGEQLAQVESGAGQWSKLLPVELKDGETWANARLLHAQLGIGEDFSTWVKRQLAKHGYVENEDFRVCSLDLGSKEDLETEGGTGAAKRRGGHNAKEYWLTTDVAKNLAMSCNTPVGKSIRSYLIDCEHRLRTGEPPRFKQLETLPAPELTHVSPLADRVSALDRMAQDMDRLSQEVKELKKSLQESILMLAMVRENPALGAGTASLPHDLKAAKDHIAELKATLAAVAKERNELKAQLAAEGQPLPGDPDAEEVLSRQAHDLVEADKRIAELDQQLQDARDIAAIRMQENEEAGATLAARVAALEKERNVLRKEKAAMSMKLDEHEAGLLETKDELIKSNEAMKAAIARIKELEAPLLRPLADTVADTAIRESLEAERDRLQEDTGVLLARIDGLVAMGEALVAAYEENGYGIGDYVQDFGDMLDLTRDWYLGETTPEQVAPADGRIAKLTELIAARERLFDQQQLELQEAKLETKRVLALIEAPEKDVTLTQFFKETETVLGFSHSAGCAFLARRDVNVMYHKRDSVGYPYLWAVHKYGCYFHHVPHKYKHQIKVDRKPTGQHEMVDTYTAKLIPDLKDENGKVLSPGGYTWLKELLMNDDRTTLQRLIAETGGPTGEFKRLDGYVLVRSKDDTLPGLMSVDEKVILFAKGSGEADIRKDEWVAGCRNKDGTEWATGLTLRDALRNLRDKLVG